jgi:hypothetical protein
MEILKEILRTSNQKRDFISDYIGMIKSFQFEVETYHISKKELPLQNTDLWIECYIDMFPALQEFRDYVRSEIQRLNIELHPDYVYDKSFNHYYYSRKRTIEALRESL